MDRALVVGLRRRGVDLLTVQEVGRRGLSDESQLEWATENHRAIYTQNSADFQRLHTEFLMHERHHGGIIILNGRPASIGEQIRGLLAILMARTAEEMADALEFLNNWR